jgi:capsular polysaccharide biosynthesis protein
MDSPNLLGLIRLIYRWRKPLLILCGLAVLVSAVVTDPHIIPPKFKSQAVILAGTPNMTSSQFLFGENSANYFGKEDDIDRLLSIANGATMRQYLVTKYKLFEHYDIDSANTAYPNTKVAKELENNFSAIKNDKGAIEITVYDTDRKLAADICNDVVRKIDDINNEILLETRRKIYNIYIEKIKVKERELQGLTDSIVHLREQGTSVNRLSDLNRVATANSDAMRQLASIDEQLNSLEERKKSGLKELNNTISLAEQYKSTLNKDMSSVFILETAVPAEKKAKPIRWLVVMIALLSTFGLTLAAAAVIERFRTVQWKVALQDA